MTLGDKPDLSIHAHPVTEKVWMYKKPVKTFYTEPLHDGGELEIFEDGNVIVFDESGYRVLSRKFKNQQTAVDYLRTRGWRFTKS